MGIGLVNLSSWLAFSATQRQFAVGRASCTTTNTRNPHLQARAVRSVGIRQISSRVNLVRLDAVEQVHQQLDVLLAQLFLHHLACMGSVITLWRKRTTTFPIVQTATSMVRSGYFAASEAHNVSSCRCLPHVIQQFRQSQTIAGMLPLLTTASKLQQGGCAVRTLPGNQRSSTACTCIPGALAHAVAAPCALQAQHRRPATGARALVPVS